MAGSAVNALATDDADASSLSPSAMCTADANAWWAQRSGASDPAPQSWVKRVDFEDDAAGVYSAADFAKDWGLNPGDSSGQKQGRLNIVADPDHPANKVLRVTYSATDGKDGSGNPTPGIGGNSAMTFDAPLTAGNTSLWLQYKVRFDDNFTWMKGGKLPGLGGGGKAPSGCIDNSKFNGFTTRLMWRERGTAYSYLYYPTKVENCGDYAALNAQFEAGKWYTITQYLQLNDVGQKNGRLIQYVDGVKVLELNDWGWRADSSVSISTLKMDTFFGGSTSDWAPKTDQYAYFDDFRISTTSPLGLVDTFKTRPEQCNPQDGYQGWQSGQGYAAGSMVYAIDSDGKYHYYQARQDVAAGVSPLNADNSLLDMYNGVTAAPPVGPGPIKIDAGQMWLERTVMPWYGNGVTPGSSWTTGSGVPGGDAGDDGSGEVPIDDRSIKWNAYAPITNGGLLPTIDGAIASTYGTATQFAVNGNATPFSIGGGNVLLYNNGTPTGTTTVRLCNTSSCDSSKIKASADSVTASGYPKTFTWLACVKANDAANKGALEIEVATADYVAGFADSSRVKAVIQKTGNSNGLQLNNINGSTSSVVKVDTSAYHIYHVTISMDSPRTGTVNAFIDGQQGTALASGPVLPYTGTLNGVSSSPSNYLYIGSGSTAYNGSLAWIVWTKDGSLSPFDIKGQLPESTLQNSPCDLSAYR